MSEISDKSLYSNLFNKLKHVAIIMDGNRRWAKLNNKKIFLAYVSGVKSLKNIVMFSIKCNLKILTLYAFSTENWNRSKKEINILMKLFSYILLNFVFNVNCLDIRVKIIGSRTELPKYLCENINRIEFLTRNNKGLKLNIAFNYGGYWDIVSGVKKVVLDYKFNKFELWEINENFFRKYLSLGDLDNIDLLIRTGGERRISNFLLWHLAYSEFFFVDKLWPDFRIKDYLNILKKFINRKRRFGC